LLRQTLKHTAMLFCKVNQALVDILHRLAKGRRIVDLGAGECLFESMYSKSYPDDGVLSIELYPEHYDHFYIPRDKVVRFYAQHMQLMNTDLPVFIRPCHHEDFVPASLKNMENTVSEAIYISNPENLIIDIPDKYTWIKVDGWIGEDDDEESFIIKLYGEKWQPKEREWWMVKLDAWPEPVKMERIERNGEPHFVNQRGGGFPCRGADFAEKI